MHTASASANGASPREPSCGLRVSPPHHSASNSAPRSIALGACHPEVFVIGDLAAFSQNGQRVPGVAPAAKQMGKHAAQMIRNRLAGRQSKPFHYRDFGVLATIGRMAAVVDLRGIKFSGATAWLFWLLAHIFFLIGFRNRMIVMIDWIWAYFTYQRSARIIVGSDKRESENYPPR